VAFAVFIAAGAFAWRAFDRNGDVHSAVEPANTVLVDLAADPFSATLTYGGVTQAGVENGSRWDTVDGTNGSGGAYAIQIDSYVRIPAGTPITIRSDAAEVSVALEARGGNMPGPARTVALDAGTGVLPASLGQFEMQVMGQWDRGFVTFAFGVRIVPRDDAAGVVLTLASTDLAPLASLSSGGTTQDGARTEYSWCGEQAGCASGNFDLADLNNPTGSYLPVPGGSEIEVAGDGSVTHYTVRSVDAASSDATFITDVTSQPLPIPREAGRYVVWVDASWDAGTGGFYFGVEILPPPDEAPDLLHLTCTPDTATLDSVVVRAQSDGVHIAVDASNDVNRVEIVFGSAPEEFFGTGVGVHEDGSRGTPIQPGSGWGVGCSGGGGNAVSPSDIGTSKVAAFTVVDPDGIYTPVELACDQPISRRFAVTGTPASGVDGQYEPTAQTVDESVAAIPGILDTDVVQEAGYPDGPGFKSGPLFTVLRDARPVARLHVPVEVFGSWSVSVDACPETGIGPDAPPGAAGPTPDEAMVRCAESRTEVSTPIVNAQADGLHVEVESTGGTWAVTIASGWDRERTFTVPLAEQAASLSIVVPARPGRVQISCRWNGEMDSGDDPFADRLSDGLQLQDPSGYFLPYAPACDSSEEVPFATAGAGVLPSDGTIVRARVPGILDSDVVERAGYLQGQGDEGLWRVVRDGEVVAQILYPAEKGVACRGSGIGGA
jgi:hypothetical protein